MRTKAPAPHNNDLTLTFLAGVTIVFLNNHIFPLSIQVQFLAILIFGFIAALFMDYLYQSLEWALFFVLGVFSIGLAPLALTSYAQGSLNIPFLIQQGFFYGKHSLFLLSSWIIAIPTGFFLQKLIMANYYRRRHY